LTYGDAVTTLQRLLAPVGFAVAVVCFALPFAAWRIADPTIEFAQTWSGLTLALGGRSRSHLVQLARDPTTGALEWHGDDPIPVQFGGDAGIRISAQPAFMVAVVLVIAGVAAIILAGERTRAIVSAVAAVAAAVALSAGEWVFLRDGQSRLPALPVRTDAYQAAYGFWVVLFLLVVLAVDGVARAIHYSRVRPVTTA
jgi:hypothetical protein